MTFAFERNTLTLLPTVADTPTEGFPTWASFPPWGGFGSVVSSLLPALRDSPTGTMPTWYPGSLPSSNNATSRWIASNWRKIEVQLKAYLGKRLSISRTSGMIADHVQDFALFLVRRDTLAYFVEQGTYPEFPTLAFWCYQKALSSIRSMGKDASTRTVFGARTTKERRSGDEVRSSPVCFRIAVTGEGEDLREESYDASSISPEDAALFEDRLARIKRRLSDRFPASTADHVRAFEVMVEGGDRADLSKAIGVNPDRASALIGRVRSYLKQEAVD